MEFLLGLAALGLEDGFADAAWDARGDAGPASAESGLEFAAKDFEGAALVLVLAALGLAGDDESGGSMAEPDRGFATVDVLSAGSAGAKGLDVALGEEIVVGFGDAAKGHRSSPRSTP